MQGNHCNAPRVISPRTGTYPAGDGDRGLNSRQAEGSPGSMLARAGEALVMLPKPGINGPGFV